jgi:hypothetical protein
MSPMLKLTPLALLVVLPACPLLDVQIDVGEVCMTYHDVRVDPTQLGVTSESFVLDDLSALDDLLELDTNLELTRAEFRATSGVTNLDFINRAHVTIASGNPESALPTLAVVDCDGDCLADGTTLSVPAGVSHDVTEYLRTGSLVVGFDVAGELPQQEWTMDVDVCMRGSVGYTLEP